MNLPKKVNIIEVGPRDGFQNVKRFIDTKDKIAIIEKLIDAGLSKIAVTSFVNPKAVPQMADAKEVYGEVGDKVNSFVLIPNKRGAELALKTGVKAMTMVISASESHNMANTRHSVDESLGELKEAAAMCKEQGATLRVDVGTVFGCAIEGKVEISAVKKIVDAGISYGISDFMLCDTTGMANPLLVEEIIKSVCTQPGVEYGVHFHNTRGCGMANILAAIELGITNIETSVGGLGGCPFVCGAAGNVATEDLVNMLNDMGIETGIDLEKLIDCAKFVSEVISEGISSSVLIAGPTMSGTKCAAEVR